MKTEYFDDFWTASQLDDYNIRQFAAMMTAYEGEGKQSQLDYPVKPTPLKKIRSSRFEKVSQKRQSERQFAEAEIRSGQLAHILGAARAWGGADHRLVPSAGASYVTELFAVCWRVEGYSGKALYYDPIENGVVVLPTEAPAWQEATSRINLGADSRPAMMIIGVMFTDRVTAKYGERGGRFALLEAGALLQQLSLTVADQKMSGVAVGGLMDAYWCDALQLDECQARVAFGYLVGR